VPHEGGNVSPPHRSSSSFRRMFWTFASLIKNQRDILVNQERERKNNKKMRDNQKRTHSAMGLQPPLSPISLEPDVTVIPSVEQMIESFQGMDFGQYDHLAERIFLEQYDQPRASSSSHLFLPRPPPFFAPQFRPGPQLFAPGPQPFPAQPFPHQAPLIPGSMGSQMGPSTFAGAQFVGPHLSIPFSGPLPFSSSAMGPFPPFIAGPPFGTSVSPTIVPETSVMTTSSPVTDSVEATVASVDGA